MIRVQTMIFCEKIMTLIDHQVMIIRPYAGGITFNAPQGHLLVFEAYITFSSTRTGEFRHDFRFLGTDGAMVGEIKDVPLNFNDADSQAQLNLNQITMPVTKSGKVVLQFKPSGTQGDDWKDCGSLTVRIPAPQAIPEGTSFEIPPFAIG